MSKHTPGPWHLDTEDEKEIVLGDSSFIATTHDSSAYSSYTSVTEDQVKANACLIAAAPELYVMLARVGFVLGEIIDRMNIDIDGTYIQINTSTGKTSQIKLSEVFKQVTALIDKVEGETNE